MADTDTDEPTPKKPNISTCYFCNVCGTGCDNADDAIACSENPVDEQKFPIGSIVYNGKHRNPMFGKVVDYNVANSEHELFAVLNPKLKDGYVGGTVQYPQNSLELHAIHKVDDPPSDEVFGYRFLVRNSGVYLVTPQGYICSRGGNISKEWILLDELGPTDYDHGLIGTLHGATIERRFMSLDEWCSMKPIPSRSNALGG